MGRLAALHGEWKGDEEFAASPWAAAGRGTATLTCSVVAGGTAVAQTYAAVRDDGSRLDAHGVLCAATEDGEVLWYWFDSIGHPPLEPARGRFEDGALVLVRSSPRGVNRTRFRLDGDRLEHEVAFRAPGEDAFTVLATSRLLRR